MVRTVLEQLVVQFIGDASQFNKVANQVQKRMDELDKVGGQAIQNAVQKTSGTFQRFQASANNQFRSISSSVSSSMAVVRSELAKADQVMNVFIARSYRRTSEYLTGKKRIVSPTMPWGRPQIVSGAQSDQFGYWTRTRSLVDDVNSALNRVRRGYESFRAFVPTIGQRIGGGLSSIYTQSISAATQIDSLLNRGTHGAINYLGGRMPYRSSFASYQNAMPFASIPSSRSAGGDIRSFVQAVSEGVQRGFRVAVGAAVTHGPSIGRGVLGSANAVGIAGRGLFARGLQMAPGAIAGIGSGLGGAAGAVRSGFGAMGTVAGNLSTMIQSSKILSQLHRIGYEFRVTGQALQRYFTYPVIGIGTAAVYSFAKFDDALTSAGALFGDVSEQTKRAMKNSIFDISANSRFSPIAIASVYRHLASANYDVVDSMKALGVVEKFATAGMFDLKDSGGGAGDQMRAMADATELLIGVQNAMGLRVEDSTKNMQNMEYVANVLVKANQLAQGTVEDFAEALTNKGAAALRLVNKDLEEGVAILAAYASQNVKGAAAGQKLMVVLRDLQKTALQHPERYEQFLGRFAIFDEQGKMRNLGDIIASLSNRMSGLSDEERVASIMLLGFQDRSADAIKQLLGMGDAIKYYEKQLREAKSLQQVVDDRMLSFSSRMKKLWNNILIVALGLGEELAPSVEYFTQKIVALTKWWDRLDPPIKRFIAYTALVLAVAGPVIAFFGAVAIGVASLISVLAFLGATFEGVVAVLAVVAGVAAILTAEWYLFGDALLKVWKTALGFMYNFQENMGLLLKWLTSHWDTTLINMGHNVGVMVGTLPRIFMVFSGWLTRHFPDVFMYIFRDLFIKSVVAGISFAVGLYGKMIKAMLQIATGDVGAAAEVISEITKSLQEAVGKDLVAGFRSDNLGLEISKILAEQYGKMRGVGPQFNFGIEKAKLDDQVVQPLGKVHKLFSQIHEDLDSPLRAVFETKGVESLIKGTAEAEAAIRHYIDTLPDLQRNAYLQSAYGATRPDMIPIAAHPGVTHREGVDGLLQKLLEAVKEGNAIAEDEPGIELVPANLEK